MCDLDEGKAISWPPKTAKVAHLGEAIERLYNLPNHRVNASSTFSIKRHIESATLFLEKARTGARGLSYYYDKTNPFLNPLGE